MIAIIDYGAGNIRSVANMLARVGAACTLTSDESEIRRATKLILPGVGHFDYGMKGLKERGLVDLLSDQVLNAAKPLLGICLGAQLLTRGSEEGCTPGLGWIAADTMKFDTSRLSAELRVPHMGWAKTSFKERARLSEIGSRAARFYYVHSFHIVCDHEEDEMCYAEHGYRFVAGVEHRNIFGVQFHPEKSHSFGMAFLKRFVDLEC